MSGTTPDLPQSSIPPWPWPKEPPDPGWQWCAPNDGATCLGGTGTVWHFKRSALYARMVALAAGSEALETLANMVSWTNSQIAGWAFSTCALVEYPDDDSGDPTLFTISPGGSVTTVQLVKAQIIATNGSYEGSSNIIHFAAKSGFSGTLDEAELAATAVKIRDAWAAFGASTAHSVGDATSSTKTYISGAVAYSRVTCSLVTYTSGRPPPKPHVDVGGQSASFPPSGAGSFAGGTADPQLPLEVACCMTLWTDTHGRSTRGRLYLGGLCTTIMNTSGTGTGTGMFNTNIVGSLAARLGYDFIAALVADTEMHWNPVILSRVNATTRGIGGVSVGQVPDSQRSRRWSQPENKVLRWGTAT
jgi:hypothetical protein